MKLLILLATLFTISAHADDLEFESFLYLIEKNPVESRPSNLKNTKLRFKYKYKVLMHIKNISKQNVKIITGNLSRQMVNNDIKEITIYNKNQSYKESTIIPSEADLKLVELRPNERTGFSLEFNSTKLILKSNIEYSITDLYNNRFNHWSGKTKVNAIETYIMGKL